MAEVVLHSKSTLKGLREALCAAQNALLHTKSGLRDAQVARLQGLIDDIDRQRPLGRDGKHGDFHTATCGCGVTESIVVIAQNLLRGYGHDAVADALDSAVVGWRVPEAEKSYPETDVPELTSIPPKDRPSRFPKNPEFNIPAMSYPLAVSFWSRSKFGECNTKIHDASGVGVQLSICSTCGAGVMDVPKHVAYHHRKSED